MRTLTKELKEKRKRVLQEAGYTKKEDYKEYCWIVVNHECNTTK